MDAGDGGDHAVRRRHRAALAHCPSHDVAVEQCSLLGQAEDAAGEALAPFLQPPQIILIFRPEIAEGLFQFIEPTFNSYAASAKKANPKAWAGLGKLNWHDWRQQALAASWAVAHGHGSAWSTYASSGGH